MCILKCEGDELEKNYSPAHCLQPASFLPYFEKILPMLKKMLPVEVNMFTWLKCLQYIPLSPPYPSF
jgi:hypothetical protein